MLSKLKTLLPEEMEAKSTVKIRKSKFGRVVFYQLLQKFEDNKIPSKERERLVIFEKMTWVEDVQEERENVGA